MNPQRTGPQERLTGKVLVTGSSVRDDLLEPLREAGLDVSNPKHLLEESELAEELADSVAYLLGGDEYASDHVLRKAAELRTAAFLGMGYENYIDAATATARGIAITNTPGTLTDSVAEYGVAQLINARRRLAYYASIARSGATGSEEKERQLRGHTFGIVGLGAIGTRIAEILTQGFNANVCYWNRTRKPSEEQRLGIRYSPLDTLAESVEGILIAVVGTQETRHLVGSRFIGLLAEGATLVNFARPDVVDPEALRRGLESGTIGTAVFDPFYSEVTVAEPLLTDFGEDRLIVTGHIASLTHDARDAMATMAVESILNVLKTGTDAHIVNL